MLNPLHTSIVHQRIDEVNKSKNHVESVNLQPTSGMTTGDGVAAISRWNFPMQFIMVLFSCIILLFPARCWELKVGLIVVQQWNFPYRRISAHAHRIQICSAEVTKNISGFNRFRRKKTCKSQVFESSCRVPSDQWTNRCKNVTALFDTQQIGTRRGPKPIVLGAFAA